MSFQHVEGAPRVPSEKNSGPLHSQFGESRGSKRKPVAAFMETIKALGYDAELIYTLSNSQRSRVMEDLRQIAERPEITNAEAADYFKNQAEINQAIAEAFRRAGIDQHPKDVAGDLEKEFPENKIQ